MCTRLLKGYGVLSVAGVCLLLAAGAAVAKPNKVSVCHVPADTPENTQLIEVGGNGNAVADHLAHGDWLVTDPICDAIADNDCDGEVDGDLDRLYCIDETGNEDAFCADGTCMEPEPPVECPCEEIYATAIDQYVGVGNPVPTAATECNEQTGGRLHSNLGAGLGLSQVILRANAAGGPNCRASATNEGSQNIYFDSEDGITADERDACLVRMEELLPCPPE